MNSEITATIGGLAAWNVIVNRLIPPHRYVVGNLAVAGALTAFARASGATWNQLGLSPQRWKAGVAWGVGAATLLGGGAWVGSRIPATSPLFDDARVRPEDVRFETRVRIPLGTVVLEEIAFRSVLPTVLDGPTREQVSWGSAGLFGLWHVLPTLTTLDINGVSNRRTRIAAVAGGVGVTAVAAVGFDMLRLRSASVLAPMLAHWAANGVSYLLAAKRGSAAEATPAGADTS